MLCTFATDESAEGTLSSGVYIGIGSLLTAAAITERAFGSSSGSSKVGDRGGGGDNGSGGDEESFGMGDVGKGGIDKGVSMGGGGIEGGAADIRRIGLAIGATEPVSPPPEENGLCCGTLSEALRGGIAGGG